VTTVNGKLVGALVKQFLPPRLGQNAVFAAEVVTPDCAMLLIGKLTVPIRFFARTEQFGIIQQERIWVVAILVMAN
jgi:hypothetical protein